MKKYILCPGWVSSKRDGDLHFIGAFKLAKLYGVLLDECVIKVDEESFRGLSQDVLDALIVLKPRYDGNYEILGGR